MACDGGRIGVELEGLRTGKGFVKERERLGKGRNGCGGLALKRDRERDLPSTEKRISPSQKPGRGDQVLETADAVLCYRGRMPISPLVGGSRL